jgi:Transcription-silencing protein Clr2
MKFSDGNSHTWQKLLKKLKKEGSIDQDIKDQEDMELAVSQQSLDDAFAEIRSSPAYRHRVGELVLFHDTSRNARVSFTIDPATRKKNILFDWKAGVISLQNDEEHEPLVEEDLFLEKKKRWAITYSGFKVELYPNPRTQESKEWSKHMVYVPLHHIRPFNYWEEVLAGIPKEEWHPTIHHAISVLSSISVLDCFHIRGVWPSFAMSCRSVWIGAELICVGDVVRLKPKQQHGQQITDVLVVDSMTVLAENGEHSKFQYKLHLSGRAFTTNANHRDDSFQKKKVNEQILYTKFPRSMFGQVWYYLHEFEEKSVVSVDCVVGRMHGDTAMAAWFDKPGNFDIGLRGLLLGRKLSRDCYGYSEEGTWRWAKTRAEQLALKEINDVCIDGVGEDVEPGGTREHMKALNNYGVDSDALDGGLVDSLSDSQERLQGASDGASARAILGGRSLGGPVHKQGLEDTQVKGNRREGSEDSSEEADELIYDIAEGRGLPNDEDRSEQDSGNESEEDELSTPNVKRLKIDHR